MQLNENHKKSNNRINVTIWRVSGLSHRREREREIQRERGDFFSIYVIIVWLTGLLYTQSLEFRCMG